MSKPDHDLNSGFSSHTAAIVLAAGKGTRMGIPKSLMPVDGAPAALTQAKRLQHVGCDPVIVVVNERVNTEVGNILKESGFHVVLNEEIDLGPLHSLRLGMKSLTAVSSSVLVLPVDFFDIRQNTLFTLVNASDREHVVLPLYCSRRGHPPVIGSDYFDLIDGIPLDEGLRGLYARVENDRIHLHEVGDPGVLRNVNLPEDFVS